MHWLAQANVRNYYMQFEENQTQSMIDDKIMEFEARSRNAFQAQVRQGSATTLYGGRMLHFPSAATACHARSDVCRLRCLRIWALPNALLEPAGACGIIWCEPSLLQVAAAFQAQMAGRGGPGMLPPRPMAPPPMMGMPPPGGRPPMGAPPPGFPGVRTASVCVSCTFQHACPSR